MNEYWRRYYAKNKERINQRDRGRLGEDVARDQEQVDKSQKEERGSRSLEATRDVTVVHWSKPVEKKTFEQLCT